MTAPRDPGLQPERTALSWRRTLLAMAVGSLLALRVLPPVLGDWSLALGLAGLGTVAVLWLLAARRSRLAEAVFRDRLPASAMPGGALLLALGLLASAGGALGLLLVLLPHPGP